MSGGFGLDGPVKVGGNYCFLLRLDRTGGLVRWSPKTFALGWDGPRAVSHINGRGGIVFLSCGASFWSLGVVCGSTIGRVGREFWLFESFDGLRGILRGLFLSASFERFYFRENHRWFVLVLVADILYVGRVPTVTVPYSANHDDTYVRSSALSIFAPGAWALS